jgi:hypothetical protein
MRIHLRHVVAAAIITLAMTSGPTPARAAQGRKAPKPTTRVVARRIRPRADLPTPRLGADIPEADLFGSRVFTNANVGFALANTTDGQVPARTTDGGRAWTIDGPQLHVDAADGAEGVEYVGIASPNVEFAYGASVVDVSTDAGHTWWEAFLGEDVTAVVPGRRGLVAFVQQSVSNKHLTRS